MSNAFETIIFRIQEKGHHSYELVSSRTDFEIKEPTDEAAYEKAYKEAMDHVKDVVKGANTSAVFSNAMDLDSAPVHTPSYRLNAPATIIAYQMVGHHMRLWKNQPIVPFPFAFQDKEVELVSVIEADDTYVVLQMNNEKIQEIHEFLGAQKHVIRKIPVQLNVVDIDYQMTSRLIGHPDGIDEHRGYHPPLRESNFQAGA